MKSFLAFIAFFSVLGLSACMPAYINIPSLATVAPPEVWRDGDMAETAINERWWDGFKDPALTALVDQSRQRNTDVLTAFARVEEARALSAQAHSGLFPQMNASGAGSRSRALSAVTGKAENSIALQPQLSVAWEADLFGRLRSLDRAAHLRYEATQAERDAVALSVAATVAEGYIALLSLDQQLQVSRETLRSRSEALKIERNKVDAGYSSELELSQAEAEYEAVAVAIPRLEEAVTLQENALSVLVGDMPRVIQRGTLPSLALPEMPGMLPSALLSRRPDLSQAALALAAEDETLESRRAEFLPSVQLSVNAGKLFVDGLDYDPVSIFSLGGSILAPLFSAGGLQAQYDAAVSRRDQAAFSYRAAALQAFAEVENGLTRAEKLDAQRARIVKRRSILERSLRHARERYDEGYSPYLEVLDSQRSLYAAQLDAIQIQQDRLRNRVALFRAFGGGWI